MCLLAVPFECYRCRWREPRGPKYVVLKLGNRFLDTRFRRSGNGGLCLNSKECFEATVIYPSHQQIGVVKL
ncbi:hypothetical protein KY285_011389 [Solanum tuberosum]|nr:hypothetical protein KY285_011389 [Solanum tuberosum]